MRSYLTTLLSLSLLLFVTACDDEETPPTTDTGSTDTVQDTLTGDTAPDTTTPDTETPPDTADDTTPGDTATDTAPVDTLVQDTVADSPEDTVEDTVVSCEDDNREPNDDASGATSLNASVVAYIDDGVLCPGNEDWYEFTGTDGAQLDVTLVFYDTYGDLDLELLNGTTVVASSTDSTDTESIELTLSGSDTLHVRVFGENTEGALYLLEVSQWVEGACTMDSCPINEVCDTDGCRSDGCAANNQCPSDYVCRQSHCVEPCTTDTDCRDDRGYVCRLIESEDADMHCALSGVRGIGEACEDMTECRGDVTCVTGDRFPNGYCAQIGCGHDDDCPYDGQCVAVSGDMLCLAYCYEDTDCRDDEGYRCQEIGGTMEACLD